MMTDDSLPADRNYERLINYICCLILLVVIMSIIYLFVFVIINNISLVLVNKLTEFPSERCTGWKFAWGAN